MVWPSIHCAWDETRRLGLESRLAVASGFVEVDPNSVESVGFEPFSVGPAASAVPENGGVADGPDRLLPLTPWFLAAGRPGSCGRRVEQDARRWPVGFAVDLAEDVWIEIFGHADRLWRSGCRGDRPLVLERYGDRREVGLGPADPLGEGLEAIAVPVGVDGLLGVEVRLLAGAGERDVGALAGGVG